MQFAVINRMIRPDLTLASKPHLQALVDHVAYMKKLHEEGKVLVAGGFLDGAGGLDIIDVENAEEAQEIYDNDPLRKALHITQEIHPFGQRSTEALINKLESMG